MDKSISILKAKRNKKTGCLEWTGAVNEDGYGIIRHSKKALLVHRVIYSVCIGPIDNQLNVLHRCDNPKCIEPKHLFAGTQRENVLDMFAKGRQKNGIRSAENNGNSKLTIEMVRHIRKHYRRGNTKFLAAKFGVTRENISSIINYRTWVYPED